MSILIKNGRVVNPLGINGDINILIADGRVVKMGKGLNDADKVIDAKGMYVFPAFVDMHCHLRDPGYEYKEDIESGTAAAVAGGFATVACMPNTRPVVDSAALIKYILYKAADVGYCKVKPIGAITKGINGAELSEMGFMSKAGAVAFSDDGHPVSSAAMMKNALRYAHNFDSLIISHCEDMTLRGDGVMNEGVTSLKLGLKGIPSSCEENMVAREALLAREYGAKVHIAHVSTAMSVAIVRYAKTAGVDITAETCPHYFSMTDEWVDGFDTSTKVNPPLRTEADRLAIIEGLLDGTIDAIATDHAPHHADDKNVEFNLAAFGISGFETAFSLAVMHLYPKITLDKLSLLMSANPAKRLNLNGGYLCEGGVADITIADLNEEYTLDQMVSKGKNTPMLNKRLKGRIKYTIVDGNVRYDNGTVVK